MMTKEKKEILLLLCLLPVLGFFIFQMAGQIGGTSRPAAGPLPAAGEAALPGHPPPPPRPAAAPRPEPSGEEKARRELADRAREVSPWSRDPFLAPTAGEKPAAELRLQGILWHPERPLATIGGNLYQEGETVGGYTIETIGPASVTLRRNGEEITLTVTE